MADCPKCGRLLSVAGTCIKCGVVQDKSKWYAIAEEAEANEKQQAAAKPKAAAPKKKAPASAKRADWYKAAGEEVPEDVDDDAVRKLEPAFNRDDPESFVEVAKGRRDPPFKLIGGIVAFGAVATGMILYAKGSTPPPEEPVVELPVKNVQVDKSYGYQVDPPDGFKQQIVPEPEFLRGVHREDLTAMVSFHEVNDGIDAYYFGEMRKDTNLDSYANTSVSDLGKLTPLANIPEGMKQYPTKGWLVDMGARKALVYIGAAKPDRYLSVFVTAPADKFVAIQPKVEAAARAFSIIEPTGPHPGMQFAPQPEDGQ